MTLAKFDMDSFFCWRVKAGKGSGLRANHYHLQSAGAANVPGFLLRHSCSPWRHHGQRVHDPTLDPGRQWVSGIGDQSSPFSPPWRDCQWSRTREDWGYWARLTSRRSAPEAINNRWAWCFLGNISGKTIFFLICFWVSCTFYIIFPETNAMADGAESWHAYEICEIWQCFIILHGSVSKKHNKSGFGLDPLPSGEHAKNCGKSPVLMGKSTINGHFQ